MMHPTVIAHKCCNAGCQSAGEPPAQQRCVQSPEHGCCTDVLPCQDPTDRLVEEAEEKTSLSPVETHSGFDPSMELSAPERTQLPAGLTKPVAGNLNDWLS